jgi:hypothetical protein
MSPKLLPSLLIAAAGFFAGCQTAPKAVTEADPLVDVSAFQSFAVLPLPKSMPGADPGVTIRLTPTVKETVTRDLAAKGYTALEDARQADFAVYVHGSVLPKTDITDWGFQPMVVPGRWYGRYPLSAGLYGRNISVDQYEEGTLIVEVYEVATRKPVWTGWVKGRGRAESENEKERLAGALSLILAKLPAQEAFVPPPSPAPAK